MVEDSWIKRLRERSISGNYRNLIQTSDKIDFVSNDYLGLARSQTLYELIKMRVDAIDIPNKNGSGGSRLLSGNSMFYESLEEKLAEIFKAESTLIFNSGYQANLALVSSIAQKGDTIIYDQLSHVCLKEGAWLSKASSVMFLHNNLEDLEKKLQQAEGDKFVILESVYSMDGDIAPLDALVSIAEKYQAKIIIDEAHSTGIIGEKGHGICVSEGLSNRVFARVYTFGKAMGVHGACIAGSQLMKEFLINFARPFIYTTALPLHSLVSIEQSFEFLDKNIHLQKELLSLISYFRSKMEVFNSGKYDCFYPGSESAIQPLIIPGNDRIKAIASQLSEQQLDVRPILAPTVKKGAERLRISLHTYNSRAEIDHLINVLKQLL